MIEQMWITSGAVNTLYTVPTNPLFCRPNSPISYVIGSPLIYSPVDSGEPVVVPEPVAEPPPRRFKLHYNE